MPSLLRPPQRDTVGSSSDAESDLESSEGLVLPAAQGLSGSDGSVFLHASDLNPALSIAQSASGCREVTWRQSPCNIGTRSSVTPKTSICTGNTVPDSRPLESSYTPGVNRLSSSNSSRSSPPPRSSSLMRAVTSGHDEEEKVRNPAPTLSTYRNDGCVVGTRLCCKWFFSWPIGGERGRLLTRVIICILAWSTLATVTGKAALPGRDGYLFGIAVVIAAAALAGYLIRLIHLPPLLGMLLAGFLLRNVGIVDVPSTSSASALAEAVNMTEANGSNMSTVTGSILTTSILTTAASTLGNETTASSSSSLTSNLRSSWSSALRSVALVIILVRAGLGLNPSVLKKAKFVILRLAFLPCLVEATVDAGFAVLLLDNFTWAWGYILG